MATALRVPPLAESAEVPTHEADEALRRALLGWYDAQARDLPWRRRRDAYAIWVSEVMLQQTQVTVVLRYWAPFLTRFPTLPSLAAASLEAVLAAWRGLGYYARARNLHRAARVVVERHGGVLPASASALAELPGFGRYTVGAVASIAFGLAEPVVDGNVARVLSRLYAVHGAPGAPAREARLWVHASRLVPAERPGDFNQALMELGATLCRLANPSCLLCPVRPQCQALSRGQLELLPPQRPAQRRQPLRLAVAVVRKRGRLLLGRRPATGLFGGLWELPAVKLPSTATGQQVHRRLTALLGKGTRVGKPLGTVHRTLTHRELTLCLFQATAPLRPQQGEYLELRWVRPGETAHLGVSAAMQAALAKVTAAAPARPASPRRRRRPPHATGALAAAMR
ncbi:MAG: A/G-specific adenine glycosylase [Myxococcaceae bacterium]